MSGEGLKISWIKTVYIEYNFGGRDHALDTQRVMTGSVDVIT